MSRVAAGPRLDPRLWFDLTGRTDLDCWGLAREIFARRGIEVGFALDAADHWDVVSGAVEAGDLILVGQNHVGIALDAREFVHVRTGAAVAVASLTALRRAGGLSGVYRHAGRRPVAETFDPAAPGCVRVVHIARPVDRPHERDVQIVPHYVGMTLGGIAPPGANAVILPTGACTLARASCDLVEPGATVLFVTAPGEPATLVSLAIGVGLSLLSIGLQLLLAPRAKTDAREESSPAFDLSGLRNTASVGVAQPVVYGTRRVAGNLIAAYQQVDANGSASLYLIVLLSRGPVESIGGLTADADDLRGTSIPDTIEIDGNAASNYDCSVSVRLGSSDQEPMPGFSDVVTAYSQTPTLYPSTPFTYETVDDVNGFDLEVTFPTGLVDVTNSGSYANRTVKFYVRHRVLGSSTWTEETWTVTEARASSFVRQFSKRSLTRARYEIQIERYPGDGVISAPWPESAPKFFSQSVLSVVNEVTSDELSYPGRALLGLKIRATDQLAGSIPTVTALVEGRKVWLWDGLSTTSPNFGTAEVFSDNNAWCALDLLLNKEYGIGRSGRMTLDQIDMNSFADWADLCDELVADGRGGTRKRAVCNAIFDSVGSAWQSFLDIARGAWAEPYIAAGKVRLALLADSEPVFLVGGGNSREVTITTLGRSQRPNSVEVQYFNEESNYDADSAKRVDEASIFTDGDPEGSETIGTVGVTAPAQAYRIAAFRRNWHRLVKQRASWVGGPDSLHLLPGDVVALVAPGVFNGAAGRTISQEQPDEIVMDRTFTTTERAIVRIQHPATGVIEERYIGAGAYARGTPANVFDVGGTPQDWDVNPEVGTPYVIEAFDETDRRRMFRIESIEDGPRQDRRFTAIEHDPDVYDDDFGDLEDFTDALPNVRAVPSSVTNLSAIELSACDCDAIAVTFDPVGTWDRAEVWFRVASTVEGGWRFSGWSRGAWTIAPVARGVSYEVAVVAVSASGTRQRFDLAARASCAVRGRLDPPDDPTSILATVTAAGLLHVTIGAPDDDTIAGYEIRYGLLLLASLAPSDWTGACPFVGEADVTARAVSKNGVRSAGTVTATVTYAPPLTLYTQDGDQDSHTSWGGTKTDVAVDASEIVLDGSALEGTYQTADLTTDGGAEEVRIRANTALEPVAMTVEESVFLLDSPRASLVTLNDWYLDGTELDGTAGMTVENSVYSLDSMIAETLTLDGEADNLDDLTPTVEYDVDEGSGFSSTWTEYRAPFQSATLDGVRVRVTMRRPHDRYDPHLVELNVATLKTSSPLQQVTYIYMSSAATAAGSRTVGFINTTASTGRQTVPTGKSFRVLAVTASMDTGATAGTYDVDAILYNVTDTAETVLAAFPDTAANTYASAAAFGDVDVPLATLGAGKAFQIGWKNNAGSPGALSTSARVIAVTGVYVDV